jgi:homoserine O-succinyltransferase/O-acetyltransferase
VYDDMTAALVPRGTSPLKAALETLRALRDIMRLALEFQGLTLESHIDFRDRLRGRFARLIAGPPASRSQQFLALVDAGVLHLPFGPAPQVLPLADGRWLVRSTRLERPFELVVDRLVRAHLDPPSLTGATSGLLANLARGGRARPLTFDGTPVGSIDLTEDFHPLNAEGKPERRLWVFGVLTEGARYFTLYIPSPKSRVRAFADAAIFAQTAMAGATNAPARYRGHHHVPDQVPPSYQGLPLRVALVNNMPDGAFAETEQQLLRLLGVGPGGPTGAGGVEVQRFTLPGIARGPEVRALMAEGYQELDALWSSPPDALVVTGAAPTSADLASEPYWPGLEHLMWWARSVVPSMLLSCLSAHAALLSFDNLNRRLLLEKCSGVFDHVWDGDHPITAGIHGMALPHSRFNEVSREEVTGAGYRILAQSDGAGWAVALAERGKCEILLLQGHPEYTPHTLLREYRRDVRKYLSGSQGSYPHVPTGYLGADGVAALAEFQAEVSATRRPGPSLMESFPYDVAARDVVTGWDGAAQLLMANWLRSVRRRVGVSPIDLNVLSGLERRPVLQ